MKNYHPLYVYCYTFPNKIFYVGQTRNPHRRDREHRGGYHSPTKGLKQMLADNPRVKMELITALVPWWAADQVEQDFLLLADHDGGRVLNEFYPIMGIRIQHSINKCPSCSEQDGSLLLCRKCKFIGKKIRARHAYKCEYPDHGNANRGGLFPPPA